MSGPLFFFFKQKTAYEIRISDWSSDVCSSVLFGAGRTVDHQRRRLHQRRIELVTANAARRPAVAARFQPAAGAHHISTAIVLRASGAAVDTGALRQWHPRIPGSGPARRVPDRYRPAFPWKSEERREGKGGVRTCQ